MFDFLNDFRNPQLFLKNIVGELFGREMLEIASGVGIFAVEITTVREQFGCGNFPGAIRFLSLAPPVKTAGELFELDWLRLSVVLPTFGQRLLVIPDFFRRMRAVEEKKVRRDARVRREDAVGQTDDGVKVEVFQQLFFDPRADAVAEERAVGHDDRGSARFRLPSELAHNELEEE